MNIHWQTMSTYVQMPTSITEKLTKKSKHNEAMTLFAIGTQIKDGSRTASYTEKDMAALFGETERTLNNYVATLKDTGLLKIKELVKGKSDFRYNSYYLPFYKENYFIVNADFLYEDIPTKLKGILLFLKANCWNGTNYLEYHSLDELSKLAGIGKNDISKYKRELERLGLIKCFKNHLFITCEHFPLHLTDTPKNRIYQFIYDFCFCKEIIPPYKKADDADWDRNILLISEMYQNDYEQLEKDLNDRCANLPPEVSLEYFCKALTGRMPVKKEKKQPKPIHL